MSEPAAALSTAYAACRHDALRLPHFKWPDVDAFVAAGTSVQDGLHTVHLPAGPHLDLLLRGRPLDPVHGTVCVFFNGAVTQRATKTAPFLSGSGVAQAVDVPLVSVADPSLLLNATLGLGWYLGSAGAGAQEPVTELLRHIGAAGGNHLVLVGGSGGGFAALQQAQDLGSAASALVWNPQTDVLEYSPRLVKEYLTAAFPELADHLAAPDWKRLARERFAAEGIRWELGSSFADGVRLERLLWLQNWDDWHTRSHMVPLLNATPGVRELWPGMSGPGEHHVVWLTELGKGHVPPPAAALHQLLGDLVRTDAAPLDVARGAAAMGLFPRQHETDYVRDLRPFRSAVLRAVDFTFLEGRKITPRSTTLSKSFGGMRFRYELVGGTDDSPVKHGGLDSTYVVPEGAEWDHVLVRVLDGFDHELSAVRFLRQPG